MNTLAEANKTMEEAAAAERNNNTVSGAKEEKTDRAENTAEKISAHPHGYMLPPVLLQLPERLFQQAVRFPPVCCHPAAHSPHQRI